MINKTESEIMKNWQGIPEYPLVSIRCITFNHEKYISQCLDGFLIQETTFPFEVVIHDDASTDKTAEIIREYKEKYPIIIQPIYESENQYSKKDGSLRKKVDERIRGKYTAFCEGDDYWIVPEKLQRQVDYLEKHPEYSMVFHAANYLKNGVIIHNDQRSPVECDFSTNEIISGGGGFCATASLCMRTKLQMDRYAFQDHANVGDYPMQIAISLKGKVHYFPEVMSVYRVGSEGSWASREFCSQEKVIKHYRNEISWLQELDETTGKRYSDTIQNRIAKMSIYLLRVRDLSYKEVKETMAQLSPDNRKMMMPELHKARLQLIKDRLKGSSPWLYRIYKKMISPKD